MCQIAHLLFTIQTSGHPYLSRHSLNINQHIQPTDKQQSNIHSDIPSLLYSENKEKIPTQGAFLSGKPKANHCFYRFSYTF